MRKRFLTGIRQLAAPFNRSHSIFAGYSAAAMVFPAISAPIVARIYSPAEFGIYAVFFSLSTILGAIASLELRNLILLEKENRRSIHGALVAILIVIFFTLIVLSALWHLPTTLIEHYLGDDIVAYLPWLPITVFLNGFLAVLYIWATREKKYTMLGRNKTTNFTCANTIVLRSK